MCFGACLGAVGFSLFIFAFQKHLYPIKVVTRVALVPSSMASACIPANATTLISFTQTGHPPPLKPNNKLFPRPGVASETLIQQGPQVPRLETLSGLSVPQFLIYGKTYVATF